MRKSQMENSFCRLRRNRSEMAQRKMQVEVERRHLSDVNIDGTEQSGLQLLQTKVK